MSVTPVSKCGSSPHTRGALGPGARARGPARIIPAYAGSTRLIPCSRATSSDHPRIRGEHSVAGVDAHVGDGSSPHTRGARNLLHGNIGGARIIPAYAGSTSTCAQPMTPQKDHPRIRGEHADIAERFPDHEGSSPHTRGAQGRHNSRGRGLGIIPAYAGSTRSCPARRPPASDHPRIRGEHRVHEGLHAGSLGSSPHTRGAPQRQVDPVQDGGIIPAYAGSTASTARA